MRAAALQRPSSASRQPLAAPASRLRHCPTLPAVAPPRQRAAAVRPAPTPAGRLSVRADAAGGTAEPFQPERPFHKGVVEPPEPEDRTLFGLTFSDVYYILNLGYCSVVLISVLTGNDLISRLAHFENYTTAMCISSAAFTLYHCVKFVRDLRQHLQSEARHDWRQMLRYAWNAVFWLGFVMWYLAPVSYAVAEYTGTPGMVMCLYGAALAVLAALQVGHFSFMGSPQVPRRLHTGGVYSLTRHPQALGNILFLVGFSLAGGAVWASLVFCAAFAFYILSVLPVEERMLREAYGDQYEAYMKRVPRFAWAVVLLVVLEAVLIWSAQPWAIPIDASPPSQV